MPLDPHGFAVQLFGSLGCFAKASLKGFVQLNFAAVAERPHRLQNTTDAMGLNSEANKVG